MCMSGGGGVRYPPPCRVRPGCGKRNIVTLPHLHHRLSARLPHSETVVEMRKKEFVCMKERKRDSERMNNGMERYGC